MQNPFSFYDFLGYFVPGAIFIFGLDQMQIWMGDSVFFAANAPTGHYVKFLLLAYLIGHLLSFLSSVTVEKYAVWLLGYPSRYLLKLGHGGYFSADEAIGRRGFWRVMTWLFLLPITLPDLILGKFLYGWATFSKPMDDQLVGLVKEKSHELVQSQFDQKKLQTGREEVDFFRLIYHYVSEKSPTHYAKLQNYVALYGFCRTICFVAVLLFWIFVWLMMDQEIRRGDEWLPLLPIIAYLMYGAFNKFFRKFSMEAMMALLCLDLNCKK